jgi:hypothetical protein
MAAPKRPYADVARERIKSGQLLKRLQEHALAPDDLMTANQIKAAEILLRKTIPDLKHVEVSGIDGGDLEFVVRVVPHEG